MERNTNIIIYIAISIISTIFMIVGNIPTVEINKVYAQSPPQIAITEAYANAGTEYFQQHSPQYHPQERIYPGATVYSVQPLQFREDLDQNVKILRVHCSIDGNYAYYNKCSTPFEGRTLGWILNAGIPINNLMPFESHTFSVYIDTDKGRTNTATFNFKVIKTQPID